MSSTSKHLGSVNWKFVVLAIVLIYVISFVWGFVIGSVMGLTPGGLMAIRIGGFVVDIVSLTIVGCLAPTNRWTNIVLVAAGVWLADLVFTVLGVQSFFIWIASFFGLALCAGFSGVISILITAFISNSAKGRNASQ